VLYGLLDKDPARRWDVPVARGVLRDLLSGSLASNAPTHHTDPYAVVPPAPYTPPSATANASEQIGGRAMLAPGESLSGAIRRRNTTVARPPAQRSPMESTAADPGTAPLPAGPLTETGAFPAPAGNVYGASVGTSYGAPADNGSRRTAGADAAAPARSGAALLASASTGVRHFSAKAATTFRGLPPRGRMAVTAGAVVGLLLLGIVVGTTLFGGSDPTRPAAKPTAAPNQPLIPVQEYRDPKGVVVNVPAGWRQSPPRTGSYMDFIDPANAERWVRINVEKTGQPTGRAVLEAAAQRFKTPSGGCPGYQQVQLSDVKLAGVDGAAFEYTCAPPGKAMRHGRWTAIVVNGMAYQMTLSVPAADFDSSKTIDDEMVRSFRLAA
jgi:hypothetical protein